MLAGYISVFGAESPSVESGVFCRLLACSVESEVLGLKAPVWRVKCFAGF